MSDDRQNRRGRKSARIELGQEHEARFWAGKFGMTIEQLSEAVRAAGTVPGAVDRLVRESRPRGVRRGRAKLEPPGQEAGEGTAMA